MPIAVQWWAVWYPGAEPGGGSYIAQRMLASKSEKDSLGAVLFFNVAHYVLRPWPWILVGALLDHRLPAALRHPDGVPAPRSAACSATTSPIPAMLKFLPVGFIGLMVGGLIAANSSTILTHLNWGASYLVHDFYRRFIRKDATEKHYVRGGPRRRRSSCSSASSALVYRARHGQGRLRHHPAGRRRHRPALPACAGSGGASTPGARSWRWSARSRVSLVLLVLAKNGIHVSTHVALLVTIAVTTVCWVATAYLGPETDRETLDRVLHEGPAVRARAGSGSGSEAGARTRRGAQPTRDNIPLALRRLGRRAAR